MTVKSGSRDIAQDPIAIEIIGNGLRSIADEMFAALMRSAYSTNIKERRDHSTAIVDPNGRLVVQAADALPIHIASMQGLMRAVLAKHGGKFSEGDLFVANDPHVAGGTHLPDINYAMPVFHDGELLAFVCNIAHHADVGGMAPGSMAGGMSEIYQEGLRIPVVKLFDRGELQEDLLDLMLLNVRVPRERRGDHFAQVAACRLGARRLIALAEQHGCAILYGVFDALIERTTNRLRGAIAEVPDGSYEFEDVLDGDGVDALDIPIKLRLTIDGNRAEFDFRGTASQVRGNVNVTLNATQASVCYALKAVLDPDIPNNQGVLDAVEIVSEPASLLDARFPASVASRAHTCQRIIDVCLGALAQAMPDRVTAAANGANTTAVFSGVDPKTGHSYLYLETLGGGMGGRPGKDGKDGVQVHITNTSNLPVEAIEMEYPLRVLEYSLVEDSGGAGQYRGGMGIRRVVTPVDHTCTFNGVGERFRHEPWGLLGGQSGSSGRFLLRESDGREQRLPDKAGDHDVKITQSVVVETPGAGGYGAPQSRSKEALSADEGSGKFSDDYLARNYVSTQT